VLVDNTTDEVDVVNVVGGGVVVKTDADEDDVFVVSAVREDRELASDEIAEDMLEIADEEVKTTGAMDVEEAGVLFDIVLIETLVDVVVMGTVVELVNDNVMVEDVVSVTIVEVVSVGIDEMVEVVMVLIEVVEVVDRFDSDWPSTKAPKNQSSNTP
jgi:hypothetical protein